MAEAALSIPTTPCMIDLDDCKAEMTCKLADAWNAHTRQKQQYGKHSRESKLQDVDRVMVLSSNQKSVEAGKTFLADLTVVVLTPTNAEVRLLDKPDSASIFVTFDCYPELPWEQIFGVDKSQKRELWYLRNL